MQNGLITGCGYIGIGNEIPTKSCSVSHNIIIENINTIGNRMGGFYFASGNNVRISNCKSSDYNRAYFYIGDAKGSLTNFLVDGFELNNLNEGVSCVVVEGEVQTGELIGERSKCEVTIRNAKITGKGGASGILVRNGASVIVYDVQVGNTLVGVKVGADSKFSGQNLIIENSMGDGMRMAGKAQLKDVTIRNFGANKGNHSGIFFESGSDNSSFYNLRILLNNFQKGTEHGVSGLEKIRGLKLGFTEIMVPGNKINVRKEFRENWRIEGVD